MFWNRWVEALIIENIYKKFKVHELKNSWTLKIKKLFKLRLTFGYQNDRIFMGSKSEVRLLPEKKKMGRPTDNPKGNPLHVRLDEEATMILEKYCFQEKVSKMEGARRGIKKLRDDLKK